MKNRTILIVIGRNASLADLTERLEVIRAIPARAAILVVGEMPHFPYYASGIYYYGPVDISPEWQEAVSENNAILKAKVEEIETLLQQHDVSGEVAFVACDPASVADAIARHALLCDITLVGNDMRATKKLFRNTVHGVLFQSPIGVLINDHNAAVLQGPKRIFIAWTTHLHTARAVHQALPLLRNADEVIIATIDPVMSEYRDGEDPGVDVAKWLTHHGCKVVVQQFPSGGKEIGDCILDRSKEAGADLVVMGAYSHAKTREAIFGGTTRTLIEQTAQAVFLVH